jgi:hypothetical protein
VKQWKGNNEFSFVPPTEVEVMLAPVNIGYDACASGFLKHAFFLGICRSTKNMALTRIIFLNFGLMTLLDGAGM